MPLLKENLPENALVNIRDEVRIYFGGSNKVDDKIIDALIDDVVKTIHRRWHPSWALERADLKVAVGTGVLTMPLNFKKLIVITNQKLDPDIRYRSGIDYDLRGFNSAEKRARFAEFFTPPTGADLDVRVHYIRKMTRAIGDSDLVDIDEDNTDLIRLGCRFKIEVQKGNIDEYDRIKREFETELQRFIDDDTNPEVEAITRPLTADNFVVDFEFGEVDSSKDITEEGIA